MDVLDKPETSVGGVLTWSEIQGGSNKVAVGMLSSYNPDLLESVSI